MLKLNNNKGFTLIELAMVLVVIGILVGFGVGMIGPLTKSAKYTETKETVNAAVESVIGYSIANNKLPDNNATTGFPTIARNPNDAWTKPLSYIYDNALLTVNNICINTTTNITVKVCPDAGCTPPTSTTSNVAFIVLSGGANYNNQTAGSQGVTSAMTVNVYDVDVNNIDSYAGDMNRPEPYDDIVKWVTLYELKTKLGCTKTPTPPSGLCPGSNSSGNVKLKNTSGSTVYVDWDAKNKCEKVKNNDDETLGGINGGDSIYVYSDNKCKDLKETLTLADPFENNSTITWSGVGSAVCKGD